MSDDNESPFDAQGKIIPERAEKFVAKLRADAEFPAPPETLTPS